VRDGMSRGLSREAAIAEARERFGDPGTVRQECEDLAEARDRRLSVREMLTDLRDDLRWTLRSLRRSPAYAFASGSTLALVVAANALVFTVVYAVLLRPLPYVETDRLLALNEQGSTHLAEELSVPNLEDLRASAKGIARIGGWVEDEVTLVNEDTPRITVAMITHEVPGDSFWDLIRKGAEAAAKKDNIELRYSNDPEAPNQANLVQAAIDSGVDGIAVTLAKPEAMAPAVKAKTT